MLTDKIDRIDHVVNSSAIKDLWTWVIIRFVYIYIWFDLKITIRFDVINSELAFNSEKYIFKDSNIYITYIYIIRVSIKNNICVCWIVKKRFSSGLWPFILQKRKTKKIKKKLQKFRTTIRRIRDVYRTRPPISDIFQYNLM